MAQKSFWTQPMVLLVDEAQVDARFILCGDSANLEARYLHGLHQMHHSSKIILDAPMVLLGDENQVEAQFSPFGDSANLHGR
jgi:hypothetical protein